MVVSVGDVSAVALSTAVAFVVAVLVGVTGVATGAITDSLMMSSSAATALRGGGAGTIRTDITATTITRTLTMDTAGTHTATTVALVMDIAMAAERVMDMAMAAQPVTDTALAANQGMCGVREIGDRPCYGSLKIRDEATCESSKSVRPMFGDKLVSELDAPTAK